MITSARLRSATVVVALLGLGAAGCSTKGDDSGAKTDKSGIKTDYGVTDSTISLGVFNDQTGPLKTSSTQVTAGVDMWANSVNAKGGICGRQIKLEVRDHGYSTDKAVAIYPEVSQKIAGFVQLTGSGQLVALKSQLESDNLVTIAVTWSGAILKTPEVVITGATYADEVINGLSYMKEKGLIKAGDKIGHVYVDGDYGESGLAGSQFYASKNDLTLVPVKIGGADTDMSAAVTKLKSENVKLVVLTTLPAQTGSIVTQAEAQGFGVPLLGSNPSFDPSLLDTPAKGAFGNYYRVVSFAPWPSDSPYAKEIRDQYATGKYAVPESDNIIDGFLGGLIWQQILTKACAEKDLTRANLVKVRQSISVDTKGLTAKLDFSHIGEPPTKATFVERVDPAVPGGVTVVQDPKASKEVADYTEK